MEHPNRPGYFSAGARVQFVDYPKGTDKALVGRFATVQKDYRDRSTERDGHDESMARTYGPIQVRVDSDGKIFGGSNIWGEPKDFERV